MKEILTRWNRGKWRGATRKFAATIGLSESYVSRLLRGTTAPTEEAIEKFSAALKLPTDKVSELLSSGGRGGASPVRDQAPDLSNDLREIKSVLLSVKKELSLMDERISSMERGSVKLKRKVIREDSPLTSEQKKI